MPRLLFKQLQTSASDVRNFDNNRLGMNCILNKLQFNVPCIAFKNWVSGAGIFNR